MKYTSEFDISQPNHETNVKSNGSGAPLDFAGITFRGITRSDIQPGVAGLKLVFPVNAELIILADKDPRFREVLARHLSTFDGFWPLLIARFKTKRRIEKISGSEFVHDVFKFAAEEHLKVFFLGSSPEVNLAARKRVAAQYAIEVEGYSPAFNKPLYGEEATRTILEEIRRFMPQILFIALGAPKQEFWLDHHQSELEAAGVHFAMAVGGTLDMLAGVYRKAPRIVRSCGLESLWRVFLDPKRLKRFPNPIRFFRIVWHR